MTFKVKKSKEIPRGYFSNRAVQEYSKRQEKRGFSLKDLSHTGSEKALRFQEQVHHKGKIFDYKGEEYVVTGVSKKGVHGRAIRYNEIDQKHEAKEIFIPEAKFEVEAEYHPLLSLD